jgi:hypothetical protein
VLILGLAFADVMLEVLTPKYLPSTPDILAERTLNELIPDTVGYGAAHGEIAGNPPPPMHLPKQKILRLYLTTILY